jgi:hypothetical protein
MAWAFDGNKQWTIPFKSFNGTSCRIDIYKKGYTGDFVYTLKGAANPFFYEEDNDSDLLNSVLRYSTGYIRVIEEYANGWLSDIYPTGIYDRYVEVYYGTTLVWNGYIQVQDFSNAQVPAPRVIELPVISPLGLKDKAVFSNILPPVSITLGELLRRAAADYDYVTFPKLQGYPNPVNLSMKVSSLVVSPWNDDYHHSMSTSAYTKVMKGETHAFFIEALCKAFGWICHDTPYELVFTAIDYEDTYVCFPTDHIGEAGEGEDISIGTTAESLGGYFSNADDKANLLTIQPDTGIEINYDGEDNIGSHILSTQRTYTPQNPVITMDGYTPSERYSLCNLLRVASADEFSSVLGVLSFDSNNKLNVGRGICAYNGKEGIMVSFGTATGTWGDNSTLFRVRFYIKIRPNQTYGASFDMKGTKSGYLYNLGNNPDDDKVDKEYIECSITSNSQNDNNYVDVTFKYRWGAVGFPTDQLPQQTLIFIHDIKLEIKEDEEPYADCIYRPAKDSDILPDTYNPQPAVSSSVDMPISMYRLNDRLIGTNVRSSKLTEYPYLFQPRKQYEGKFRVSSLPTYSHMRLYSYMDKKWRIIAQRFDPWNDEVKLTMQHSPII